MTFVHARNILESSVKANNWSKTWQSGHEKVTLAGKERMLVFVGLETKISREAMKRSRLFVIFFFELVWYLVADVVERDMLQTNVLDWIESICLRFAKRLISVRLLGRTEDHEHVLLNGQGAVRSKIGA